MAEGGITEEEVCGGGLVKWSIGAAAVGMEGACGRQPVQTCSEGLLPAEPFIVPVGRSIR